MWFIFRTGSQFLLYLMRTIRNYLYLIWSVGRLVHPIQIVTDLRSEGIVRVRVYTRRSQRYSKLESFSARGVFKNS